MVQSFFKANLVVPMVAEIVKLLHKNKDSKITLKQFIYLSHFYSFIYKLRRKSLVSIHVFSYSQQY